MTPFKVLHLNAGNLYGGVETFLRTLAECRSLAPAMTPEYALCYEGRHADELRAAGCKVHLLGAARASRPWTVWRARRRLATLLRSGDYAAVACHQPWIQALFGGVVRRCGVKYVAYFHNPLGGGGWEERRIRKLPADLMLAPSPHTIGTAAAAFPGVPAEYVHYPLPHQLVGRSRPMPEERATLRAGLGLQPEDVLILQASRIEPWKGPDVVLEALGRLRDVPHWKFWLAGGAQRPHEHELHGKLVAMTQALGLADRVRLLGHRDDVPKLLAAADICTQGNRGIEGFGLTFLEASQLEVPVVTTVPGSLGDMVDATNGLVVPDGDVPALAEAYRRLVTDAGLRAELGRGGAAKARRQCDPAVQLPRLAALLLK